LRHLSLDPDGRQATEPLRDAAIEARDRVDGAIVVRQRRDLAHRPPAYSDARAPTLEQDLGGGGVRATAGDHLDREVQVGFAHGEALGEVERIAGLDQNVKPPALDFRALAGVRFCDLRHLAHGSRRFVLATTNPAPDSWR